jgi:hypothetical protein
MFNVLGYSSDNNVFENRLKTVAWTAKLLKLVLAVLIYTYMLTQTHLTAFALAIAYTVGMGLVILANFALLAMFRFSAAGVEARTKFSTTWKSGSAYRMYLIALILDYAVFVSWYWTFLSPHSEFRTHPHTHKIPHVDDSSFYTYQALNIVFVVTSVFFLQAAFNFTMGKMDRGRQQVFHIDTGTDSTMAVRATVGLASVGLLIILLDGLFAFWVAIGFDPAPLWVYMMYFLGATVCILFSAAVYFLGTKKREERSEKQLHLFYDGHWQSFNMIQGFMLTWWVINFSFWLVVWSSKHGTSKHLTDTIQFKGPNSDPHGDGPPAMQEYFLFAYQSVSVINAALSIGALYYLLTLVCATQAIHSNITTMSLETEVGEDFNITVAVPLLALVEGKEQVSESYTVDFKDSYMLTAFYWIYFGAVWFDLITLAVSLMVLEEGWWLNKHYHEWIISYSAISGGFNFAALIITIVRLFWADKKREVVQMGTDQRCVLLRTTATNWFIYTLIMIGYWWVWERFNHVDLFTSSLKTTNERKPIIWWNFNVLVLLWSFFKVIEFMDIRTTFTKRVIQTKFQQDLMASMANLADIVLLGPPKEALA